MDDLMKCLYDYVCEERMGGLLSDPEYKESAQAVELQAEKLEQQLSPEQRKELRWILGAAAFRDGIENEHLFRAALELFKELNGLVSA